MALFDEKKAVEPVDVDTLTVEATDQGPIPQPLAPPTLSKRELAHLECRARGGRKPSARERMRRR